MIIKLKGGKVYDPEHEVNGKVCDIYIEDGHIIEPPADANNIKEYDISGKVVMAGAIDIHTHIGGGKVNIARLMMPEDAAANPMPGNELLRSGAGHITPSTLSTGYRYAEMGYTACFEPAILPANARQAHMEMADTPIVDTGGYVLLGNDDLLLQMLADNTDQTTINHYVAWILDSTQCIGIKVVNAGGLNAFKFNQRQLDVDQATPCYGVTPRLVIETLARAIDELDVPHPLHVHASNLGCAGNVKSTMDTVAAAGGHRLHLAHVQFHSYGAEGDLGFSSAGSQIAEVINQSPNVTADVGQIMFGQTITTSGDSASQYYLSHLASPKKWTVMDIECEAGCGVVPFHYSDKSYINALQWAIGLELFLMVNDPWRVFLTTDHPNGAPFTSYPHLIRLLMDRSFRNDLLTQIHPEAAKMSHLSMLDREYSLYEIAVMTRSAPARILGLRDKGHLGAGASADIVVYEPSADPEQMFSRPVYVFKSGEIVVEDGVIKRIPDSITHTVKPEYDKKFIEKIVRRHFEENISRQFDNAAISADEMSDLIGSPIRIEPCRSH